MYTLESNEKLIQIINEKQRQVDMLRTQINNIKPSLETMKKQFQRDAIMNSEVMQRYFC